MSVCAVAPVLVCVRVNRKPEQPQMTREYVRLNCFPLLRKHQSPRMGRSKRALGPVWG